MAKGNLENKVQKRKQKAPRDNHFQYLAIFLPRLFKINANTYFYILHLFTKLESYQIHTLLSLLSKCKNSSINRITLFKWIEMKDKIKTFRVWTFFWSKGDAHQRHLAPLPWRKGFIPSFQKKNWGEEREVMGRLAASPEVCTIHEFILMHSHFRLPGVIKTCPYVKKW